MREQRDLQGKDPNYKVLMIRITRMQVWTSVPKSRGFREGEALLGGTRSRWAGTQGTWVCLQHSRSRSVSFRKDSGRMPDPRGYSGASQAPGIRRLHPADQFPSCAALGNYCLVSVCAGSGKGFAEKDRTRAPEGDLFSMNQTTSRAC